MGILDQTSDPTTVGGLLRLIRDAWAEEPSFKVITTLPDGSDITATVAGLSVPHGCTRRIPRSVSAQAIGVTGAVDAVTVGSITRTHVTVYAAAVPTKCHLTVNL
jgi:hypothetical protein